MGTDTTTIIDGPAAADQAAAGPTHSVAPTPMQDAPRVIVCALLVAGCVASPESAALLAPFVPALVAIRVLRHGETARRFLLNTSAAAIIMSFAVVDEASLERIAPAIVAAMVLVPFLGLVHDRAALRDPIDSPQQVDWPEPRIVTGLSLAVSGWVLAVLVIVLVAAPAIGSPGELGRGIVKDAYAVYTRECAQDGAFAERKDFCEGILAQRDQARDLVDERALELLAALLAVFAWGAAATAHPIVLTRARRSSARVRPAWRLRDLEVHWSAAYLVAAGIGLWLGASGDPALELALRAIGIFIGTLGVLLVMTQGFGLVAWLLTRGRTPGWYRAFLIVATLFVLPVAAALLFGMGVVDMAIHPRRRALKSAK